MFQLVRNMFRKDDDGVSPVIGTILMVAVTVVLGATVFAAVNSFGNKGLKESQNAVWRAQALDTDGNGKTDTLKITYMTGPSDVADSQVIVSVSQGSTAQTNNSYIKATNGVWNPGDFMAYTTAGSASATYFVSVTFVGTTVLDQSIKLDE